MRHDVLDLLMGTADNGNVVSVRQDAYSRTVLKLVAVGREVRFDTLQPGFQPKQELERGESLPLSYPSFNLKRGGRAEGSENTGRPFPVGCSKKGASGRGEVR